MNRTLEGTRVIFCSLREAKERFSSAVFERITSRLPHTAGEAATVEGLSCLSDFAIGGVCDEKG